jgi:sugar (pentulose or hexulose) kinase
VARKCIGDLCEVAPEARSARGIGVSTTFPGVFAIDRHGVTSPESASLYDNSEDAGLCGGGFEKALARAEDDTLNRMWPGNMAVGLIHLVKDCALRLDGLSAIVPPNTAFAHALLRAAGCEVDPRELGSDFTQTVIGGLYDARTARLLPEGVRALLAQAAPEIDCALLAKLLPEAVPAWTNVVSRETRQAVREFLRLPELGAVSIGAGDSALATLALLPGADSVLNVRGSSDTPVLIVGMPKPRTEDREAVLHYPMVTAPSIAEAEWCVAAPMLRSGRVWDWVKRLRFSEDDPDADTELERLASQALARRGARSRDGLRFRTVLGGERAPDWDPCATGSLTGLVESHSTGDIALAALEGMSLTLRGCISLMESRYGVKVDRLLLAGGPTRNALWNWVTEVVTGKETWATEFSDASVMGAALLGYASSYDGTDSSPAISARLKQASKLCSSHPLIRPKRVEPPDRKLSGLTFSE